MKKLLNLLLAMLAVVGVACTPNNEEGNGNENNGPNAPLSFTIQLSNITSSSVKMDVVPSNNTDTYFFDVVEKSVLSHYASLESFVADYISQLKDIYEQHGMTLGEILSQGPDSWEYEVGQLFSNTEYYAFAFGLTAEGVITSEVAMEPFTTLEEIPAGPSDNEFSVTVSNVTDTGALVSVTPSNNDTYYFDVIEKEVYDMYTDKKEFAAEYIAEIKALFEAYGYSLGEVLSSGNDAYSFEGYLEPNTAYYAFAVGVSTSGVITTDVAAVPFTTLAWGGGNSGGSTGGDKDLTCFELGYYENWGDYYGTNATNWYIDFYSMTSNDYFVVELQGDLSETAPVAGEYKILSTCAPGTAVAGGIDADGYGYGTFWALIHDSGEYLVDKVFCTSGTVKVSKSGDLYNIDVDAVGENGESVKMSYAGVLEEWVEEYSLSDQKLSNGLNKRFCTVSRLMKQKQVKMAPMASLKKQAHSIVKLTPKKVAPKSSLIKRNVAR